MARKPSFAVLGAGSWGTALAILLADNGHTVNLWVRDAQQARDMDKRRENSRYLPGAHLPPAVRIMADAGQALTGISIPLLAVPSSGFRTVLRQHAAALRGIGKLVWATKGLEEESHCLLHEVATQELGERMQLAVISGPNFAAEVAKKMPTATTIAANNADFGRELTECLHNDWFRAYRSADLIGVQLGGALKNALAIASGIADGLHFGANARAALLTRGLAEITRLTVRLGGQPETLTGLAGVGDLLMTCTDNQSRNRRLGLLLAAGKSLQQALSEIGQAVEGVKTAHAAYDLARQQQVDLPIIEQVYKVLFEGLDPRVAVKTLLARDPKPENG
jgi:glycerol-3-phosphate dehydrogenase (NAD(P)+)